MKRIVAELIERHVPHVVGLYIAAVWGLVQFVDWSVEEFVLSPHLPGFVFLFGLLLIPSVALLTWRLGADAEEGLPVDLRSAGRVEMVGVVSNVAIVAIILFLSYGGRELGSATRQVRLVDEAGDTVTAQVPNPNFVEEVLLFHFDNETQDDELDWISYAIPVGITEDLRQDPFVTSTTLWNDWFGFQEKLSEHGLERGTNVPLALKRELAGSREGFDHFLAGSFRLEDGGMELTSSLYETRTGRLVAVREFSGDSLLPLLDEVAEQVRRDLGVPEYRLEIPSNFPVSEVLTNSEAALQFYALSQQMDARDDADTSLSKLEAAVSEDSTFAQAYRWLAYEYLARNRRAEADSAMARALRYSYRLPERERLALRFDKHRWFDTDFEKALRIAEYMVELSPHDEAGYIRLRNLYEESGDLDAAIEASATIAELDPTWLWNHLKIGFLYSDKGDHQRALESYKIYADALPDDAEGFIWLSRGYQALGRHEDAVRALDRAEITGTDPVWVNMARAELALDLGRIEEAARYRDTAKSLEGSEPRGWSYFASFDDIYYTRLGRFREAIEAYYEQKDALSADPFVELARALGWSDVIRYAAHGQRQGWALDELDSLSASVPEPYELWAAGAYMSIYLDLRDTVKARAQLDRTVEAEEKLDHRVLTYEVAVGRARLAELSGDCREARKYYEEALSLSPSDRRPLLGKARCQHQLGDHAAAEHSLLEYLVAVPADPYVLLQLAQLYDATDRKTQAIEQLEKAIAIWRDADPEFIPAQRAHSLAEQLQAH